MPYNVPTLKTLIEQGLIDVQSSLDTVLPKFGVEQALNSAVSGSVRDLYDYQTWIVRQIIPTSESDDQTIIDAAQSEGVVRKLATYASGTVTFSGTNTIPESAQMTHSDGRVYTVTSSSLDGSSVNAVVQSEDTGVGYNVPEGEVLTLVSTVSGVSPQGSVTAAISGGAEIESVSEVLERLLFRKRNPPMGGAVADYVAWCREVAGVTRAWSYDAYQGGSTVGYAFVFDGRTDIIPTSTDITAMVAYIFRHQDPATGMFVGRPGGIEAIYIGLTLKPLSTALNIVPDTTELRASVSIAMSNYIASLSPGLTLLLSSLRTAIGAVTGLTDYTLALTTNVTADTNELHSLGAIAWGDA
jgi:uncharacterized phage protein gp47/JayE